MARLYRLVDVALRISAAVAIVGWVVGDGEASTGWFQIAVLALLALLTTERWGDEP